MNAVEIYEKASWDLEHNKITLGEFEERIKALYDVEPVRHGRWEDIEQHSWSVNLTCRCQICGWIVNLTQSKAFAYCPNCGARMDGESDE